MTEVKKHYPFFLSSEKSIMYHKIFHYRSVDIKNSYTGKNVKGFKFPADGMEYKEDNPAGVENLQQMQIYFGVHIVIASLQDLMRVGTKKTNKLYEPLYKEKTMHCRVESCIKNVLGTY